MNSSGDYGKVRERSGWVFAGGQDRLCHPAVTLEAEIRVRIDKAAGVRVRVDRV